MKYKTRFAPSPTGDLHIGGVRTAYFNWLAARSTGGEFVLRIDDTDDNRNISEAVDTIYEVFEWLGLDYDVTFRQSDRYYTDISSFLVGRDLAYEDDGAIRLRLPPNLPDSFDDVVSGNVKITDKDKDNIDGMVLVKSNGKPTYHFASVVDDWREGINFVIRGNDHLSNTAKHIAIYKAMEAADFGLAPVNLPKFAHIGLIHKDKKKLSKRDSAASTLYYRDNDYDPDALLNFLARLGWGPVVDDKSTAILTRENMINIFLDGGRMRPSPANVDMAKLESFNRKYKAMKR